MSERKRILVVEDDQDVLNGLVLQLRGNGYEVLTASDTVDATAKARHEEMDLVLLDLGLPAGDGFVFMDRLRSLGNHFVPIVVYSARNPDMDRRRALEAGAVAFVQKPSSKQQLLDTIAFALGEGQELPA